MKNNIIPILAIFLLLSCGNDKNASLEEVLSSKNLTDIRSKRTAITEELKVLEAQITQLDAAILELDGNAKLPLVSVLTVNNQEFHHYIELQGDVMTKQNVLIYPEMAGTLKAVYVKEGQRVHKGQLLASIDDGGMSSQVSQLKTQAELAKTTFERQKRLWDQNIGSEIQYLQAKSNYEATENAVKQAQSQLGRSTINAPFSGIIDNIIKEQGTVVAPGPGSEVFRIVNLSEMHIEIEVPEAHLSTVTKGKNVEVSIPILGKTIQSKIQQTGNFINPGNRSFQVEIPIANTNGDIKPNLTAVAKINDYSNPSAILIPQSVLSENATGEQYVYLAKTVDAKTIAEKKIIELGKTQGDNVEVLSGLQTGDKLIVEGARSVRNQQQIKIFDAVNIDK